MKTCVYKTNCFKKQVIIEKKKVSQVELIARSIRYYFYKISSSNQTLDYLTIKHTIEN